MLDWQRMNIKLLSKPILVLALAACTLGAQAQFPDAPSAKISPTKGVILNITALDGHGDPVTDLARDDFQIFDDGKRQTIASFQAGAAKPVAETPPPSTLILFDLLNSNAINRDYTSTFIVHALEPLETADNVYLYLLTNRGEVFPVHPFPLTGTTVGGGTRATTPWTRQVHPLLDQAIQKVYGFRPADDRYPGYRSATTFQALSMVQDAFAAIPGSKTIVWITSGVSNWPDYPHGCKDTMITEGSGSYVGGKCTSNCRRLMKCIDYEPFLQHFTGELNQSNTLLYAAEDLPVGAMPPTDHGTAADTLRQLADLTGGRVFLGTNMDKAITEAIKNARGRYQVTIAAPALDSKHHKLRVACARKGVKVDGPRGYWATQP